MKSTFVKNIKKSKRFGRAGIILYTFKEGKIYFGLGMSSKFHQLTDFGGSTKKERNFVNEAIREFEEETLGIFSGLSPKILQDCVAAYCDSIIIIFVHVNIDIKKTCEVFEISFKKQLLSSFMIPEVCSFVWIDKSTLNECLNQNNLVFDPVKNILKNFNYYLL